ncbi:glycosyltransferase [Thermodesulfobacteriota bacterium]
MNLHEMIKSANWQPTDPVNPDFVLHPNKETSSALFWHIKPINKITSLSIIIPTIDAKRNDYFSNLLKQLSQQTFTDFELLVIKGDSRQGRAINIGASIAQGKYLMTLDDDTSLPDKETLTKLINVMEKYPEIGMAGGNNIIPTDANRLVCKAMQDIPRRSWKPVTKITDSDLAEHPCLMMRTLEFKSVGGENELLPRGLDPYLRQAFRKIGKRVVLVPDVIYHHLPPDSLAKLLRQFFRNGRQAAYVNRHYPQWVIETPSNHGDFTSYRPFRFRVLRFPARIIISLLKAKYIRVLCDIFYAIGFLTYWTFSFKWKAVQLIV